MDYFEYPSTVAMLLREIRYGINLGLTNITIDPFMTQAHARGHTSAHVSSEGTVADESASGRAGRGGEAAVVSADYHFHVGDINVDYLPGKGVTTNFETIGRFETRQRWNTNIHKERVYCNDRVCVCVCVLPVAPNRRNVALLSALPPFEEVMLVIVLRVKKHARRHNLRHNVLPYRRRVAVPRRLGGGFLLRAMVIDRAAVLRPDVVALAIQRRCVVPFPQHVEKFVVRHDRGVVLDRYRFGVPRRALRHRAVIRFVRVPSSVADTRRGDAGYPFEGQLHAPEAARGKGEGLEVKVFPRIDTDTALTALTALAYRYAASSRLHPTVGVHGHLAF
jgi:hypothetical protein